MLRHLCKTARGAFSRTNRLQVGLLCFGGGVLALVTWYTFRSVPAYLPGQPLLVPPVTLAAHAELAENYDLLQADKSIQRLGYAYRELPVSPGQTYHVLADLRCSGLEWREDLARNSGRLVFLFRRNGKPMHGLRHTVAELRQHYEWHAVSNVFTAPAGVSSAFVGLDLWAESGEIALRNLEIREASLSPWHYYGRPVLLVAWIVALVVLLMPVLIPSRLDALALAAVVTAVTIVAGATVPKPTLLRLKDALVQRLASIAPDSSAAPVNSSPYLAPTGFTPLTKAQKAGHLVLFALLFALIRRERAIAICMGLAATTEFLQFFVADREPSLIDFGIDCAGILLGAIVLAQFRRIRSRVSAQIPHAVQSSPCASPHAEGNSR